MKLLIALLTISVQLLDVYSNPCRWLNDGIDCVIQCLDGTRSDTISGFVQTVYDEFPDCHSTGVKLILPQDSTGSTVRANWLSTLNINLTDLEIDAKQISDFDPDVFTSEVFAKVKKLHFKNFYHVTYFDFHIKNKVFIGFHALEELMITNSIVKLEGRLLDYVNATIKSLTLTGEGHEPPMLIENLTGGSSSATLVNVDYVKVQYNLTNNVNTLSFTSIPNVRELDLSGCSINAIQAFSFEKIGSKLQLLNLERNNLKTLPSDIFTGLYLSSSAGYLSVDENAVELQIRLSDNPWDCDCSLEHLQDLLKENTNFVGDVLCATPDEIVNYPIRESEFCPIPVTTTSTTTTTTESTTVPNDTDDSYEKECSRMDDNKSKTKISIQPKMQQIQLTNTSEGVSITLQKYTTDVILIWFKSTENVTNNYETSNISHCFTNLSHPIRVVDLRKDTSYTFCLMNISQQTVSPFDCISYHNHVEMEKPAAVWLYANEKPLSIFLIVVVCVVNIFIGVIFGATFLKFNGYNSFSFRRAFWCSNSQSDANKLNRGTDDSNDRTPPLPPHPLRDVKGEDVYYY